MNLNNLNNECPNCGANSTPAISKGGLWIPKPFSPFKNTNTPIPRLPTMDQTVVNGANFKSPGKSPLIEAMVGGHGGPGRTMKECEDQLEYLKKENFNLKLRIYFLEERMGFSSADENFVKTNIELKVENEELTKDLREKQELLSQAAKAMQITEDQKQEFLKNEAKYEQTLKEEREKITNLERELNEYKGRLNDVTYYEEAYGITPEMGLELKEKLHQVEEIKASLEIELKQLSASLDEERNWAQELESERDELKKRLETEIASKDKLTLKNCNELEDLNEKIKLLEAEAFNKDGVLQQLKKDISEKDKVLSEKCNLLEEKCKAYEQVTLVAEKRKKQIDQLRSSIKSRDDALTDLNNKNRSLLKQFENNYTKRCMSPQSPSVFIEESQNFRKTFNFTSPTKSFNGSLDLEPTTERARLIYDFNNSTEKRTSPELRKELEDKDKEIKKQEDAKKQLQLKLFSAQHEADDKDKKLKKLEGDHKKAIQMLQGFMKRHEQLEDKQTKKDRRIKELEIELRRLRSENVNVIRNNVDTSRRDVSNDLIDSPDREINRQRQLGEMEMKLYELRTELEAIKAQKILFEQQITIETKDLNKLLLHKDWKIDYLECEKNSLKEELELKSEEFDNLKALYNRVDVRKPSTQKIANEDNLREKIAAKNLELEEKNEQIRRLKEKLKKSSQHLQKPANTELSSKNKEIAILHNDMTAYPCEEKIRSKSESAVESTSSQLTNLVKELNNIGIHVKFTNDVIQLNYANCDETIEVSTMSKYVHQLTDQKNNLEKEVDCLKWLHHVSKPVNNLDASICDSTIESNNEYCHVLRRHLMDLVQFMKEMLRNTDGTNSIVRNKQKRIVFQAIINSKILSDDIKNALEGLNQKELHDMTISDEDKQGDGPVRKCKSDNFLDMKNQMSNPSDSETFSEPDRRVSLERMGLLETSYKSASKTRSSKLIKTFSDSDDSGDYRPCHKCYQNDLNDFDAKRQILELKQINCYLSSEFMALKNINKSETKTIDDKMQRILSELEKLRECCELLQDTMEKKIEECQILKKECKRNRIRKMHLETKILEVERKALEVAKQKTELLRYKEKMDKKTSEKITTLRKDSETLRTKANKLEHECEEGKTMILQLTRELDQLTLKHSQILVENTKLTNDKLRLEQELRKSENRYDVAVRTLEDKFHKEVSDLNQINESHRARLLELETANKELQRHVAVYEASDSAPTSSGISSIPLDVLSKPACDDMMNGYLALNSPQYWNPTAYPASNGGSKSSCSPDLGIESDAAASSTRPLKDTLKITESMNNLLSDDDIHQPRDPSHISPLPAEGGLLYYSFDEFQLLKQENLVLKNSLMNTKRTLVDTFEHLANSNKTKKNVEQAIMKQLLITRTLLKKTQRYHEQVQHEN